MDFSHYSGYILFMFIATAGFWLLIFLLSFVVPYWLTWAWIDIWKEKKEKKQKASSGNSNEQKEDSKIL